jgi:hypothetical protein
MQHKNATYGWALTMVRDFPGYKMRRMGWNGSDQFVCYMPGYPEGIPINKNTSQATGIPEGTVCKFRPYLLLQTAQGDFVPWSPSVSDSLAYDWEVFI